jgi:hypothetical protein
MIKKIEGFSPETQQIVAQKWNEARLGALKPNPKRRPFSTDDIAVGLKILDDAKRETPEDAVIVHDVHQFEGSETAVECATCGHGRVDELHLCDGCSHPFVEHDPDGCQHVDEAEPLPAPGVDAKPCPCGVPGPVVQPAEESREDARDSAHRSTTSEAGTTGAGVPPKSGKVTESTGDPTSLGDAESRQDPSPGSAAADGEPAGRETGTQPVSRAAVTLPLCDRQVAERVAEVAYTPAGATEPKLFMVSYQLVSLPLAARDLPEGTNVEFVDADGHRRFGVVRADYRAGDEPF